MKERRTALYDRSSFNRDIMEIYKVMKYRIYFFLIVFVFMIGGLWASPVKVIVRQPVLPVLTLKEANPVLRLEFVKQASGDCACLLYTSPSPRDGLLSRMPSSA